MGGQALDEPIHFARVGEQSLSKVQRRPTLETLEQFYCLLLGSICNELDRERVRIKAVLNCPWQFAVASSTMRPRELFIERQYPRHEVEDTRQALFPIDAIERFL